MNYQSIPRRFSKPTSAINHQYIDSVLREKQGVIDTNFGILQKTVDSVLGQDLIREQDREYLRNKVSGVLETLGQTETISFDSTKARFSIQSALSEAAKDPEVLRQIANTKKVRQIQQFQQDRQKKGDLNQQNFIYAYNKAGIDSYISGNSDTIGNFNYLEYTDVDAKLLDSAKKLKAMTPDTEVQYLNADGLVATKKVSAFSREDMQSYLSNQLSPNELKQLEIDGAMTYGMNDAKAIEARDLAINEEVTRYKTQIDSLKKERDNGGLTPSSKKRIDERIATLEKQSSNFQLGLTGAKTAEQIGGQKLLKNKLNLYSNLFTKASPESIKYDADFLKRMRDAREDAVKPMSTKGISTITVDTELTKELNLVDNFYKKRDSIIDEKNKYVNKIFNDLPEGKRQVLEDTKNKLRQDVDFINSLNGEPLTEEVLDRAAIASLGNKFFPPDVSAKLLEHISNAEQVNKDMSNIVNNFNKTQAASEEVFDQVFGGEQRLTMIDSNGEEVNMKDFLSGNKVKDLESYKNFIEGDTKEARQFRATLSLQSMSLTSDIELRNFSLNPIKNLKSAYLDPIFNTSKIDLNEDEYQRMKQASLDITGDSLDKTYNIEKIDNEYVLTLKSPTSNFAKIVSATNNLYLQGEVTKRLKGLLPTPVQAVRGVLGVRSAITGEGSFFSSDKTARNESNIKGKFDSDEFKMYLENNSELISRQTYGSNMIRLTPENSAYQDVMRYYKGTKLNDKEDIDVIRDPKTNRLIVRQTKEGTRTFIDNVLDTDKMKYSEGVIEAADIPKMGNFNSQISMLDRERTFSNLSNIKVGFNDMSFIDENPTAEDTPMVDGLDKLFTSPQEQKFKYLATADNAREVVLNPNNLRYLNRDERGSNIITQFEDFIENTQDYTIDFIKGVRTPYRVVISNKDNKKVGEIPIDNSFDYNTISKVYRGTPQVFLAMYSQKQIMDYMKSIGL